MMMNHAPFHGERLAFRALDDRAGHQRTVERAEKNLQRMLDWIGRHDMRTAALLGLSIAMIGALASATPPSARWTLPYTAALACAIAGYGLVVSNLMYGMFPRIRGGAPSAFFFGSVAQMSWDDYRERFLATDEAAYLDDILAQSHINAQILTLKFRAFDRAARSLLLTSVPWALSVALGKSLC